MNEPAASYIGSEDVLGFDADDTLWYSSLYYDRFKSVLMDLERSDPSLAGLLDRTRDLQRSGGSGEPAFAAFALQVAAELGAEEPDLDTIRRASESFLAHPIELMPGLEDFLHRSRRQRKVIVTRGTELNQRRKLELFRLADRFEATFIVPRKDEATYREILGGLGVDPARFVMIGDGLQHDVAPVIAIGGRAVWMNIFSRIRHKGTEIPLGALHVTGWSELLEQLPPDPGAAG